MMKQNFQKKWLIPIVFALVGTLTGYLHWYFYGCVDGCTITGVWYNSSIYGAIMGYLIGGMVNDYFYKQKTNEQHDSK